MFPFLLVGLKHLVDVTFNDVPSKFSVTNILSQRQKSASDTAYKSYLEQYRASTKCFLALVGCIGILVSLAVGIFFGGIGLIIAITSTGQLIQSQKWLESWSHVKRERRTVTGRVTQATRNTDDVTGLFFYSVTVEYEEGETMKTYTSSTTCTALYNHSCRKSAEEGSATIALLVDGESVLPMAVWERKQHDQQVTRWCIYPARMFLGYASYIAGAFVWRLLGGMDASLIVGSAALGGFLLTLMSRIPRIIYDHGQVIASMSTDPGSVRTSMDSLREFWQRLGPNYWSTLLFVIRTILSMVFVLFGGILGIAGVWYLFRMIDYQPRWIEFLKKFNDESETVTGQVTDRNSATSTFQGTTSHSMTVSYNENYQIKTNSCSHDSIYSTVPVRVFPGHDQSGIRENVLLERVIPSSNLARFFWHPLLTVGCLGGYAGSAYALWSSQDSPSYYPGGLGLTILFYVSPLLLIIPQTRLHLQSRFKGDVKDMLKYPTALVEDDDDDDDDDDDENENEGHQEGHQEESPPQKDTLDDDINSTTPSSLEIHNSSNGVCITEPWIDCSAFGSCAFW